MTTQALIPLDLRPYVVLAKGEAAEFHPIQAVRVMTRAPIGHYRVPNYLRGKAGVIAAVIQPMAIDNEEEAYGRNAGAKGHYYRVRFAMREIWPDYAGSVADTLLIEIFQTWLEPV
jgi:hypothetical protein